MNAITLGARLLPLFLLAASEAGDRPELLPEVGRSVRKVCTATGSLSMSATSMSIDGEERPVPEGLEQDRSFEMELTVLDELLGVEDGRITKLRRTFEDLTRTESYHLSGPGGEQDRDANLESELEDQSVIFTWDADEEEYGRAWDEESDGDEDLLEDLDALFELADFLPPGEVEEGDSWELDPDLFQQLLEPFGDLSLLPDDLEEAPEDFDVEPDIERTGDLTATYAGTRDADGVRVGVIHLAIDVRIERDMTEVARASVAGRDVPEGTLVPEFESVVDTLHYEGEGSLLWDLEHGLLHSLESSCDVEMTSSIASSFTFHDQSQTMERADEFEGTRTVTVRFER